MNYISIKHLEEIDACGDQVNLFKELFGESVSFKSEAQAKKLARKYAQDFDFDYVGREFFGKAYEEAEAPLLKAYEEAKASLWKAYSGTKAPLFKAYEEAEALLWEDYWEAQAELFASLWWNKETEE